MVDFDRTIHQQRLRRCMGRVSCRGQWANKATEGLLLIRYYLRICGGHIVMGTSNSTDTFWPLGRFGLKEIVLTQSSTNCKRKHYHFMSPYTKLRSCKSYIVRSQSDQREGGEWLLGEELPQPNNYRGSTCECHWFYLSKRAFY